MAETRAKFMTGQDSEKAQEEKRRLKPALLAAKALADESIPSAGLSGVSAMELPAETHAAFVSDPRFSHLANNAQKAGLVTEMQQTYGNQHVQRLVQLMMGQTGSTVNRPESDSSKRLVVRERSQGARPRNGSARNTVFRWAEHEHKVIGDLAAEKAMKTPGRWSFGVKNTKPAGVGEKSTAEHWPAVSYEKFIKEEVGPLKEKCSSERGEEGEPGIGVAHYKQTMVTMAEKSFLPPPERAYMSFGDATMLGGDYFKTAEALKAAPSVNPSGMKAKMLWVAATNVNHFFPLAGKEWETQWGKAVAKAKEARAAHTSSNKDKADEATEAALRYLAVACHFQQDTFASGHQYPGALDSMTVRSIPEGQAYHGWFRRKPYHDRLCKLENGLPMQYEKMRFHGDKTADKNDITVIAEETYRALAHILSIIADKPMREGMPQFNPGPDVPAIMQDEDAATIWTEMVVQLENLSLPLARRYAEKGLWRYETSAGTPYSAQDIIEAWKTPGFLEILKDQSDGVFRSVITTLTPDKLKGELSRKQWEALLLMCARRYPAGENLGAKIIARNKDHATARALVFGQQPVEKLPLSPLEWVRIIKFLLAYSSCEDEDAIVKIVKCLVNEKGAADAINWGIGRFEMYSGLHGARWREVKQIMKGGGHHW